MAVINRNSIEEIKEPRQVDLKEYKLSNPVSDYFTAIGFEVYSEVCIPTSARCTDLIALKNEKVTAIELKTSLTKQVIKQAHSINIYVDCVYVAVGTNPRQKNIDLCKRWGIGVIKVRNGKPSIVHKAEHKEPWKPVKQKLLEQLSKWEPGGVAGLPMQKGVGPAIDCYERVEEYKKNCQGKPTWKQIFENVPNHYSSPQIMASALNKFYKESDNEAGIRPVLRR